MSSGQTFQELRWLLDVVDGRSVVDCIDGATNLSEVFSSCSAVGAPLLEQSTVVSNLEAYLTVIIKQTSPLPAFVWSGLDYSDSNSALPDSSLDEDSAPRASSCTYDHFFTAQSFEASANHLFQSFNQ